MFDTKRITEMTDSGQQAFVIQKAGEYVGHLNKIVRDKTDYQKINPNIVTWQDCFSLTPTEFFYARMDYECKLICAGMADWSPDSEIAALSRSWTIFEKSAALQEI
jgi:hypothetical protein